MFPTMELIKKWRNVSTFFKINFSSVEKYEQI